LFLPINDNNAASYSAFSSSDSRGSHWSILAAIINKDTKISFLHFDSSRRFNAGAARAVAKRLSYALAISGYDGVTDVVNVVECRTPQQTNGYDCGVYALAAAEILSRVCLEDFEDEKRLIKYCEKELESLGQQPDFAVRMRRRIADDIRALIGEKQKVS